jgi:competence protein ComEA
VLEFYHYYIYKGKGKEFIMSSHLDKYWLLIIAFLLVTLVSGGILLAIKQSSHRPVEISLATAPLSNHQGEIYIDGAVVNPGFYPIAEGDTLEALVQAAGLMPDADTGKIKIYVPKTNEGPQPQRIDLNRADAWLLDALPGIGPDRAQAIVDYRNQNGPFHRLEDLLNIGGIGGNTLDTIRDLITLED